MLSPPVMTATYRVRSRAQTPHSVDLRVGDDSARAGIRFESRVKPVLAPCVTRPRTRQTDVDSGRGIATETISCRDVRLSFSSGRWPCSSGPQSRAATRGRPPRVRPRRARTPPLLRPGARAAGTDRLRVLSRSGARVLRRARPLDRRDGRAPAPQSAPDGPRRRRLPTGTASSTRSATSSRRASCHASRRSRLGWSARCVVRRAPRPIRRAASTPALSPPRRPRRSRAAGTTARRG